MKNSIKKILIAIILTLSLSLSACALNLSDLRLLGSDNTEVINGIQENGVVTSNVTILTYNFMGKKLSQGSGVLYKNEGGVYYALTNNHVVFNASRFQIIDAYGDVWNAVLVHKDETYDLAVIKFAMNTENFFFIPELTNTDPKVGDKVISTGNPNGVINSVTLGEVEEYVAIIDSVGAKYEGFNVEFKVIRHNAPIDSGSSGGGIFTYDYKLCGINFASGRDEDGNYLSSYAIQPTKIIEFLENI